MSSSVLPWGLGLLFGGGITAIVLGERSGSRRRRGWVRRGEGEGEGEGDGEEGVVAGRSWSLVVLVSMLIVSTMLGVGAELLTLLFQKRVAGPAPN